MFASLPAELTLPVQLCAGIAALCWLLSVITREYSWVDRSWSIIPGVYASTFAARADFADARVNLVAGLIVLWCIRLTFNTHAKVATPRAVRTIAGRCYVPHASWALQVFNVFFIAGYQHLLVFLITLPIWQVWAHRKPLGAVDIALATAFLLFLAGETLADQQQWNYHQWKKARVAAGELVGNGFLGEGSVDLQPPPKLLLRAGHLVGSVRLCCSSGRGLVERNAGGPRAANAAVPRVR